jgi:adenylate cyclase
LFDHLEASLIEAVSSPTLPNETVLAALDELLNDPGFKTSARNKRFLRFVVEETLAGRASRIKSYTIAVDVFGRSAEFDGSIDPIVRIEASRLRAALASYYHNPATSARIEIVILAGSYVPQFRHARQHTGEAAAARSADASASEAGLSYFSSSVEKPASVVVRPLIDPRPPILLVEDVEALTNDGPTRIFAQTLVHALLAALGQFGGITIMPESVARDRTGFLNANATRLIYLLAIKVRADHERAHLWWHLSHPQTMEICWTASQSVPLRSISEILAETTIAEKIALVIGERDGLIKSFYARLISNRPAPGYSSVLLAERATLAEPPERRAAILEALEKTVALDPEYAEAWAYLAVTYSELNRNSLKSPQERQALMIKAMQALRRAALLAPYSATTYYASSVVYRQLGDVPSFEAAVRRAIEVSPLDPKIQTFAGNRFWENGRFDEGVALIRRGIALRDNSQPVDGIALGYESFRLGQYQEGISRLRDMTEVGTHMVHVGLVASYGQSGDRKAAQPYLEQLLALQPDYGKKMRDDFKNRRMNPFIVNKLADGLQKAGLPVADAVPPLH